MLPFWLLQSLLTWRDGDGQQCCLRKLGPDNWEFCVNTIAWIWRLTSPRPQPSQLSKLDIFFCIDKYQNLNNKTMCLFASIWFALCHTQNTKHVHSGFTFVKSSLPHQQFGWQSFPKACRYLQLDFLFSKFEMRWSDDSIPLCWLSSSGPRLFSPLFQRILFRKWGKIFSQETRTFSRMWKVMRNLFLHSQVQINHGYPQNKPS